jgi:hypothetical protein
MEIRNMKQLLAIGMLVLLLGVASAGTQAQQSAQKEGDVWQHVGALKPYSQKGVIFFDDFSAGLGKWRYSGSGVSLLEISGNKFARLQAAYPGDPAMLLTDINVTSNTQYTLTFKINGAGGLYINRGPVFHVGSGNYNGSLSGFIPHTQSFNTGNANTVEIMFMAYGHNFAVDDVEVKN